MIKTRDVKFISDALEYARKNKNSKGYTIVSFLVQGKRIISIGVNDYRKTHAKTPQIHSYVIPGHSEIKCLAKYLVKGRRISSAMTLYVVGLTQGKAPNPVISSKPCDSCENFIYSCGIPRVVYFENVDNKFEIKEWRRT